MHNYHADSCQPSLCIKVVLILAYQSDIFDRNKTTKPIGRQGCWAAWIIHKRNILDLPSIGIFEVVGNAKVVLEGKTYRERSVLVVIMCE